MSDTTSNNDTAPGGVASRAGAAGRAGHIVIAPDKFKGSLTAPEVAAHVGAGLHRFWPAADVLLAPIADGGDGTLDAVLACGYTRVPVVVGGPTGQPTDAAFARKADTALVELAEASGLRRLPGAQPDPMHASSRGTGELMREALDAGCDQIVLGLGGSASTDGGAGMLQALGVRLLDARGSELGPGGGALARLDRVDLDGLDARLRGVSIVLACDVDNPLMGPAGAAAVFAPQKGATGAQVHELDLALRRWAEVLAAATGHDVSGSPGAGAAGGVGFGALAVLGARLRPGIALVLDLIGFDDLVAGARLVITGEGSLDHQSLRGKAPIGVAVAAARRGVPTVAVAGACSLTDDEVRSAGLRAAYALTSFEPDVSVCMSQAGRLLEEVAATVIAPRWISSEPPAGQPPAGGSSPIEPSPSKPSPGKPSLSKPRD